MTTARHRTTNGDVRLTFRLPAIQYAALAQIAEEREVKREDGLTRRGTSAAGRPRTKPRLPQLSPLIRESLVAHFDLPVVADTSDDEPITLRLPTDHLDALDVLAANALRASGIDPDDPKNAAYLRNQRAALVREALDAHFSLLAGDDKASNVLETSAP
jgi:hypothetical protein